MFFFFTLAQSCGLVSGFYLISPSEFERFSLSTRHVVEPRSLVEAPFRSASSNQRRPEPDGVSSSNRYVYCNIVHFPVGAAHLQSVNFLCLYLFRQVRQDSEDAGKIFLRRPLEHACWIMPTEHFTCLFLITFGLVLFSYTHTHIHTPCGWYLPAACCVPESAAKRVMEHALLNDEREYLRDR